MGVFHISKLYKRYQITESVTNVHWKSHAMTGLTSLPQLSQDYFWNSCDKSLNFLTHFSPMYYFQAFTNCVHGYDRARNVYANGVTRAPKFVQGIDSCVKIIWICQCVLFFLFFALYLVASSHSSCFHACYFAVLRCFFFFFLILQKSIL